MNTLFVFVTGVLLRLAVPILLTALVVFVLHKLDVRWQAEAEIERSSLIKDDMPCWKEQGLALDEIKFRASKSEKPCWQMHRLSNGHLRETCLSCDVFLSAPIPVPVHLHSHS